MTTRQDPALSGTSALREATLEDRYRAREGLLFSPAPRCWCACP